MKIQKRGIWFTYLFVVLLALSLSACGGSEKKTKAKSIEEIQKEEGVPVVVEVVKKKPFAKQFSFFGTLEGIKQTVVGAMIGGRIEKINFRPGSFVRKGDIVIEFPEDSPAAKYQQAKAAYENSKKNYERIKALYEAGETSKANFEGIEAKYLVDKRNYETMRQLLFLDAPYNGVITEMMVDEGDNVKAKTPLFTIAQLHKLKTKIWLSPEEVHLVKKGMPVKAKYNGKTYKGKIQDVSVGIDPFKQAFGATVVFDNRNGDLRPGLTLEVIVLVYQNRETVIVPLNLVKQDEQGDYVFTISNSKVKKSYVTPGQKSGLFVEISEGLQPGDSLIIKGVDRVFEGTKIKVIE